MLNWNGHEDTVECLKSLTSITSEYNVYLVDNNSKRESVDYILNYLKNNSYYNYDIVKKCNIDNYQESSENNLLFILNDENAGFAGGNNVALEYVMRNKPSDYVLLLNNDTVVSCDFIEGMLDVFKKNDNIGFVGTKHYYYDNKKEVQTIGGGLVDLVHGEAMAVINYDEVEFFDFITGSCILMPMNVLEEVGCMSTDYFMYWEDVDWSTVVREHGYKLKVSKYGCIYHKEGASIKSLSRIYYHMRNRIWYMKRHTSGLIYYKFIIYIILFGLKESFTNIIKNKEYSKVILKGLKDGLLKK